MAFLNFPRYVANATSVCMCMYYIICIPRLTALDKTQGLDSRGLSYKNTKHKMNTCKMQW